jgi:hypothetical protein
MRNCVVFTFLIVAQIVKGGRGRRRVGGGRLALAGGHVVREERCNSARSQDYSRPWVTSLYRYKFQIISGMSVLSGGGFSVFLQQYFVHRLQRGGNVGLTPRRKQGNKD